MTRVNRLIRKILFPAYNRYKESYPCEYYYERLLEKSKDLSIYTGLLEHIKRKKSKASNKSIGFSKNISFGDVSKKYILKRFGQPKYKFFNLSLLNVNVFFYRIMLGGHKVKFELHFYKDKLFHYSYTFSYLNKVSKKQIIEMLEKKYINGEHLDFKEDYIHDMNDSTISFSGNHDFTINYINNIYSIFFENAQQQRVDKINEEEKRKQKKFIQMFNRL